MDSKSVLSGEKHKNECGYIHPCMFVGPEIQLTSGSAAACEACEAPLDGRRGVVATASSLRYSGGRFLFRPGGMDLPEPAELELDVLRYAVFPLYGLRSRALWYVAEFACCSEIRIASSMAMSTYKRIGVL